MLISNLLLLYFSCALCLATEENVIEFTDDDFESEIAEYDTTLVMFYAPWCGHCKKLKPKFAKAAEILIENDPPVHLAKIDCTEPGKDTCEEHKVTGYPSLKIFRSGKFLQDYDGSREVKGIVKYMQALVGPVSKELNSTEELEKFHQAENEVTIVGFFEKNSDLKVAFLELAEKLKNKIRFAHFTNKAVLDERGFSNDIALFRPHYLRTKLEDDVVTYFGSAISEEIDEFITKNYHGLVGHRKSDNKNDFQNPLVVVYYKVDYKKDPKGSKYWRNRVLKVAKQYQDKFNFAISSKTEFKKELDDYGIDPSKYQEPIVFARNRKNQKFYLNNSFSVDNLNQFVKDILDDKLEPHIKSQPIPETNDGLVKVAVARNFDDVVMNNGKDTFLDFYVSWCSYCQFIEVVFDDLAKKLEGEDVIIAKMEASENEVPPPFQINGYPTIYFIPKNSRDNPVVFNGERDSDEMLKFIAEHATEELKRYDRKGKSKMTEEEVTKVEKKEGKNKTKTVVVETPILSKTEL